MYQINDRRFSRRTSRWDDLMKAFSQLSPREILAVAISSEEEDERIYLTFADDLRNRYPASAKVFEEMASDETEHRRELLER